MSAVAAAVVIIIASLIFDHEDASERDKFPLTHAPKKRHGGYEEEIQH